MKTEGPDWPVVILKQYTFTNQVAQFPFRAEKGWRDFKLDRVLQGSPKVSFDLAVLRLTLKLHMLPLSRILTFASCQHARCLVRQVVVASVEDAEESRVSDFQNSVTQALQPVSDPSSS